MVIREVMVGLTSCKGVALLHFNEVSRFFLGIRTMFKFLIKEGERLWPFPISVLLHTEQSCNVLADPFNRVLT